MILALDIETNLAHDTIWCCGAVWKDLNGELHEKLYTAPETYGDQLDSTVSLRTLIDRADTIVFHNGIEFDIPKLSELWGIPIPKDKVVDTVLLSRLWNPSISGGHSLKAWGLRFKDHKGDFEDFDGGYTEEMGEYCLQDTKLTLKLYEHLTNRLRVSSFSQDCIDLEHEVMYIVAQQVRNGFKLDVEKATELYQDLWSKMIKAQDTLQKTFPPIVEERWSDKTGKRLQDKVTVFNPGSRKQIAERLIETGVVLTEKTEKGSWKIDEKVLQDVGTKESELILEYFLCEKRTGQIDQWLNYVTKEGRVHGKVYTNAAVTGRMTHCVPLSTKALTREGWREYGEIDIGDEVLGFNMETGQKEWTKVKNIHYSPEAVVGSIGTQNRRIRCTEDHKVIEVISPGKSYQRYELREASKIRRHSAVLMNAPYNNSNEGGAYRTPLAKYSYNHCSDITRMNDGELNSFMTGFLLADGHLRDSTNGSTKSWSFAQAEGELLEVARIAMFLYSDKRISQSCKNILKGSNQRYGYNITQTQCSWMRSKGRMEWIEESIEPVWCLETELGTWTMLQEDGVVSLTGNSSPNVAQVPSCSSPYGKECRECWTVDEGNKLVGIDASGLELRMLAHYMNDEDYTKEVVDGDIHTKNQEAAELPSRDTAKTFIYAFLYGAGAEKIGSIVGGGRGTGTNLKKKFLANTPALAQLITKVKRDAEGGSLVGLDGRKIRVRSEHAALNTLLQSAGAIVMKKALVIFVELLESNEIPYKIVANVHDEIQVETPEKYADDVGEIGVAAIEKAGEEFKLNCPLTGEYQTGGSWAETH